jgi:hypothetical protein
VEVLKHFNANLVIAHYPEPYLTPNVSAYLDTLMEGSLNVNNVVPNAKLVAMSTVVNCVDS